MSPTAESDASAVVDSVFRAGSRRALATLIRLLGDFDLAEEALQDAFAAATERWPREGIPEHPVAWLVSTGRFKAIDLIRRRAKFKELVPEVARRLDQVADANATLAEREIEDDRLRLIFTCCHPAIDRLIQVPLTLREVCGLTTDEIARAFLVAPTTMAQRIVRGKSKIRDARIPYAIPSQDDLPERLEAVLSVIYLVFNEGYSASSGEAHTRGELSDEAIRLARLVLELLPDPEVMGLLALMLLHESRRAARTDSSGNIILLGQQDRSRWNRQMIVEGKQLIERSLVSRCWGSYTLQAAISAVHADATSSERTDWPQIVGLYDLLLQISPSPVVELNRAVAVAKRDGPAAGLELIDAVLSGNVLANYHLAHSARGELLRELGRDDEAAAAYSLALSLAKQEPERRLLLDRLESLPGATRTPPAG